MSDVNLFGSGAGSRYKTVIYVCPKCRSDKINRTGKFYGKCGYCGEVFSWKSKVRTVSYY